MMEEICNASENEDMDFYDGKPAGERWAPLGANDLDDETTCYLQGSSRYVCFLILVAGISSMHSLFQCTGMIM
jgi:hypothetical protein